MAGIALTRDEALDLLILLERVEGMVSDVEVLFQVDGFIRILMDRVFPDLPDDEDGR